MLQVAPQFIVPGELVTLPEPLPAVLTVRVKLGAGAKFAVADTGEVPMVKVHGPVPVHAPVQPEKIDPAVGVGVSVTALPLAIAVEFVHVPVAVPEVMVQLIPPVPATEPLPVPVPVTVTLVNENVAPTATAEFMVTEQAAVPEHAPVQPENAEPAGVVGVRSTVVPAA